MSWICKQHGKDCQSYVTAIVRDWEKAGYTPATVPKEQERFKKCVEWILNDKKI